MKYILAAVLIALASPAKADCAPAKKLISVLLDQQYTPQVEMAIKNTPVVIFVNPHHQYIVVEYRDEKTACIIAGGEAFYILRTKKA